MNGTRVTVRCRDCTLATAHETLRDARVALNDHESSTDHRVDCTIESVDSGVSQAGADAGVCGRPECANEDSPLVDPAPPASDS